MKSFLISVTGLASLASAKEWAVIVAGSDTYANYRHQSDACHAYQVVHEYGIPDEQIITMMVDDIASNQENPFKGQMFNQNGMNPQDVYKNCKIDYKGRTNVNPGAFAAVLTGDSQAVGGLPVLQSTEEDTVFVNFVDHGGVGIIAFPQETMSAKQLNNAIETMSSKKMFKKLVFYMEACESGSMWENLKTPNVYVTTAANADESSWGTYCPPDDLVNGRNMNTCLGDLYSVNWMQNADQAGPKETLEAQYDKVKQETAKSHVMQYGDLSFTSDPIGDFMGMGNSTARRSQQLEAPAAGSSSGVVSSRDIPLHLAYYKYLRSNVRDFQARQTMAQQLQQQLAQQVKADQLFHSLSHKMALGDAAKAEALFAANAPSHAAIAKTGMCTEKAHLAMHQHCGGYTDYSLQYARVVASLCVHSQGNEDAVAAALVALCQQ